MRRPGVTIRCTAGGEYKFTLAMDLDRMQKEFGADSVILLRTHYYIADMLDFSQYEGFVFNASQYEDVSRLYLASDLCITDYSSVFFDYANLKETSFYSLPMITMHMPMRSADCISTWKKKNCRVRFFAPMRN